MHKHLFKLLADSNILAFPEAGRGNCLPYAFLQVRRINIEIKIKKIKNKQF